MSSTQPAGSTQAWTCSLFEPAPLVVEAPPDVAALTVAAEQAARVWHLPNPELIRVGANGVFVAGAVILRVGVSTAPMGKALAFAERLTAAGIRVARPARADWLDLSGGLSVTAWERIDFDPAGTIDWERIGTMVATIHDFEPTTVDHPLPFCGDFPWWNFDAMLADVEADATALEILRSATATHAWWYEQARGGQLVVCHGDVHPGNVLVAADGPVLIDWDLLCVGPPAWDHAALATWTARWGGAVGVYEAFARGYGRPVDSAMLEAIAELRLVAATLMRLKRARLDPAHRPEAEQRLRYWRGDPDAPMWRAQ
jgi:Ser/Thr protein kinase RdoA (MazF antagonist)